MPPLNAGVWGQGCHKLQSEVNLPHAEEDT